MGLLIFTLDFCGVEYFIYTFCYFILNFIIVYKTILRNIARANLDEARVRDPLAKVATFVLKGIIYNMLGYT